jgi:hypothetical protein
LAIVHLIASRYFDTFEIRIYLFSAPIAFLYVLCVKFSHAPPDSIGPAEPIESAEAPLISIFLFGMALMLLAPLLQRYRVASLALAGGACLVLIFSLVGLLDVDPRIGLGAIESNRKEYLFFMVCEAPVLMLALLSWKIYRWAFWVGWGINAAVSLVVLWVFIELTFFWHW